MLKSLTLATAIAVTAGTISGHAQNFPDRGIKIVVPYTAGGLGDVNTRRFADTVSKRIGQSVTIENRPGAASVTGAMDVKKAPPDGYTLFLAHIGSHALNKTLVPNLPYDPVKDFEPITTLFSFSNILVVPATLPVKNTAELVALAKQKPGGLSYASQGVGSGAHLLGSLLQQVSGAPLTHVPYPGAQQQVSDIITGRVDMGFFAYETARPFVEGGKMKFIASAASTRRKELPNVPTLIEDGYPTMVLEVWYGLVAPAGTPAAVVDKLRAEFTAAARDPELMKQLDRAGVDIRTTTGQEFIALMNSEADKWGKVLKGASGS